MIHKFGLLGKGIGNSLSPILHRAAAMDRSLHVEYVLLDVEPPSLGDILDAMRAGRWHGLNVTAPYKRWAFESVDCHDPIASALGVVNTIAHTGGGGLMGFNTDRVGMVTLLAGHRPKKPLILGAGGAARVAAHVLAEQTASVIHVLNRSRENIDELDALAPGRIRGFSWSNLDLALSGCDVVINCLPSFMGADLQRLPWSALAQDAVFVDTNYGPDSLALHTDLDAQRVQVIDGTAMLIAQGIESFHIWTACHADPQMVGRAVHEAKKRYA